MDVTDEQKEHVISLLEVGQKLEAVRYLQRLHNLDAEQALTLTEKIEFEINSSEQHETSDAGSSFNVAKIVGTVFLSIGLLLLGLSLFFGFKAYRFKHNAFSIPGKVIDLKPSQSLSSDKKERITMYAAVIEYTFYGHQYQYISNENYSTPPYNKGDSIALLVDRSNPGEPVINSFFNQWFVTVLLGSLGLIFAAVGWGVGRVFGG
jgi:hypothetical protein